jgi:hypothetical protein
MEVAMIVAVGQSMAVPVEVICVGGPSVHVLRGYVRAFDQRIFDVELDDQRAEVPAGTRVVLDLGADFGGRVRATVAASRRGRVHALLQRVVPPEKRTFPRLLGTIPLRWCAAPARWREGEIDAWLQGAGGRELVGAWSTPDPLMNFSVTGLSFEDLRAPEKGALVLLELGVAEAPQRWRATGRVVRVEAQPAAEGPAVHAVAVEFEELPDGAREALTAYTLRRQEHVA